jgi:hypothetical protein
MSDEGRKDGEKLDQDHRDDDSLGMKLTIKRREFLRALGLLGGGAILYSSPLVRAGAAYGDSAAPPGSGTPMLDLDLPARYRVKTSTRLNIAVNDKTVPVDFQVAGEAMLEPVSTKGVANVRLLSMRLTSKLDNPLEKVGMATGRISAQVPARTIMGTLNLGDGRLAEKPLPLTIAFAAGAKAGFDTVKTTLQPDKGARIIEGKASGGDAKCTKRDDIDLSGIPMGGSKTGASGAMSLPMIPS